MIFEIKPPTQQQRDLVIKRAFSLNEDNEEFANEKFYGDNDTDNSGESTEIPFDQEDNDFQEINGIFLGPTIEEDSPY